jgi:hypothetical protein
MDQAPRYRMSERQSHLPINWFELAVEAADKAFILAAASLGLLLVALLVYQNLLS